jgi:hypothetical protein
VGAIRYPALWVYKNRSVKTSTSLLFSIKYSRARKSCGHSLHSDQETDPHNVEDRQISATAVQLPVTVNISQLVLLQGSKSDYFLIAP